MWRGRPVRRGMDAERAVAATRRFRFRTPSSIASAAMLIGVDVGGTFTDAVLALDGRLITAKAPTTPEDQSEGVMAAIEAALEKAGADAGDIDEFSHGMTVATNALLEGRGARTAFVATEGFTDLIAVGRQDRPQLYG